MPAFEGSGEYGPHRAAGLGQTLPREVDGVVQAALKLCRVALDLTRRLQLGDDAGQALSDRVVDLPGDPLSLVGDACFPGLGDQLGVETGVLVQGRLQFDERAAALLTELGDLLAPDSPEPDGDGLDHEDDPEGPPLVGGRIGVDDPGVDDQRGQPDPDERERRRLEEVRMDETGDDEHEVDG